MMFFKFLIFRRNSILAMFNRAIAKLQKLNVTITKQEKDKLEAIQELRSEIASLSVLRASNDVSLKKIKEIVGE